MATVDITALDESTVEVTSLTKAKETPEETAARLADEVTLARGRKVFRTINNSEDHFRTEAVEDTKFRAGTWGTKSYQWPNGVQEQRMLEQRPCLTVNRAPSFVRQVTNQARSAHLRIQVNPVDDKGDPKLAEVLQGIIHNIEVSSMSDRAYNAASDKQAEQGRGCFKLVIEYADDEKNPFRKRIKVKRVTNPLRVFWSHADEADYSDAKDTFEVTDVDAAEFEEITGEKPPTPASIAAFDSGGTESGDWFPNGKYRIAQWFSREFTGERKRKALLSTGDIIDYPTDLQLSELKTLNITVKESRWVQKKETVWRKITAMQILEKTIWPADANPYIPVLGDELEVEGERDCRGVIRDSKDSGRVYNVFVSNLTEQVNEGTRSTVVGLRGQFGAPNSEMRKAWSDPRRRRFLEVEALDIDGKPAPIPRMESFEPPIEGTVVAIHQADEDYKTTAGFRDASLGERGPQESGKAILARQRQDELGSSHYLDNLRFALCSAGRQLIQLIRVVYDAPTVVRITGADEKKRKVMVFSGASKDPRNEQFLQTGPDGQKVPYQLPEGVSEIYDLSIGEFDVEVSAGPSTGSRRQEETEAFAEILKILPPEYAVKFFDIWVGGFDSARARAAEARAKKMLPQELQDDTDGTNAMPPQAKQMIAQLESQLQEAMQLLQTDKLKLDTQERIAAGKDATSVLLNREDNETRLAVAELSAKVKNLELFFEERSRLGVQAHDLALGSADAGHEHHMAELAHQQALEAGQQAVDGELVAGQQDHANATAQADQAHAQTMAQADQGQEHALEQGQQAADLAPPPAEGT